MKAIVGLTGGLASGKSTVAAMFAKLGVPVIDADELARKVVEPGSPGLAALVKEFGNAILRKDGSLDRERMAELAFQDTNARQKLNQITHPLIAQAGMQEIAKYEDAESPFVIYEAALLVENRAHLNFKALIVVDATEEHQISRAQQRNQLTAEQALARIRAQASRDERKAVATFLIENHGDLIALEKVVRDVYKQLMARFEALPST